MKSDLGTSGSSMTLDRSQAPLSPPPTPCMSQDSARLYDYEWQLQQLSHTTGVDRSGLHETAFADDRYDETKFWSSDYPHFDEFVPIFHTTNGHDSGISQTAFESLTRHSASHAPNSAAVAGIHNTSAAETAPPRADTQLSPRSLGVPVDDEQGADEMDFATGDDDDGEEEQPKSADALSRLQKRKLKRFRLTHSQTRFLMSEFAKQAHPDAAHRERLSREIPGLTPRQVQVWFQNRRAKLKRLTTEDRERTTKSRALPADFDSNTLSSPYLAPARQASITSAPVRSQHTASQVSDTMTRASEGYRQGPVGSAPLMSPERYSHVSRKTSSPSHFDLALPDSATTATMPSGDGFDRHVQGLVGATDVNRMSSDQSHNNYLQDLVGISEPRGNFTRATIDATSATPWWSNIGTGAASFDWNNAATGSSLPQRGNTESALRSSNNEGDKSGPRRATVDSAGTGPSSNVNASNCPTVDLYNQLFAGTAQHTDLPQRRLTQMSSAARLETRPDNPRATNQLLASPSPLTHPYEHYLNALYPGNTSSPFSMYPNTTQQNRATTPGQPPPQQQQQQNPQQLQQQQQQQYHHQNPNQQQQQQQQQQRAAQSRSIGGGTAFAQSIQPTPVSSSLQPTTGFPGLDMRPPQPRWSALAGVAGQVMTDAALLPEQWEDPNKGYERSSG